MFYLKKANLFYYIIPGNTNSLIEDIIKNKYYEKFNHNSSSIELTFYDYEKNQNLFDKYSNTRIIAHIRHPYYRIWSLYYLLKSENNKIPFLSSLENFIDYLYKNKKDVLFNTSKNLDKQFQLFIPQLYMISPLDNCIQPNIIYITEDPNSINICQKMSEFYEFINSDETIFKTNANYLNDFTTEMKVKCYQLYYPDFDFFKFDKYIDTIDTIDTRSTIPEHLITKQPIFTIITPSMGNATLKHLKQCLRMESVPYIHIILWDKNRVNDSINPKDLEDDITFCYEFRHPYHEKENQRNDVWLRGVGATLVNTPYLTYFDDDTWPCRNHLYNVIKYMTTEKLDFTFCQRMMWEKTKSNKLSRIGIDDFEAIGEKNKLGYRLIDNSSLYMKLDIARKISTVFLGYQYYGDDRITPDYLDSFGKGKRMLEVCVNHIAKPILVPFFKQNII
jgi:hypothetical protein